MAQGQYAVSLQGLANSRYLAVGRTAWPVGRAVGEARADAAAEDSRGPSWTVAPTSK